MKSLQFLFLAPLAITAALLADPVTSATPPGTPGPITHVLDVDGDGILSAAEIDSSPIWLTALDLNEDGSVSSDEYRPATPETAQMGYQPSPEFDVIFALDSNHDGIFQQMEISQANANLKRLDLNADGRVTRNEMQSRW